MARHSGLSQVEEILRERALQRESRQSHLMELDASVRMERAVTSALSHADELEGHEFRDALPREGHVSMLHALTETRCGVQGCAHGACNASGLCECDDGWSGAGCDAAACKDRRRCGEINVGTGALIRAVVCFVWFFLVLETSL